MLYDTKISNNEFNGLYISSIVNKFISYALIYFYVIVCYYSQLLPIYYKNV